MFQNSNKRIAKNTLALYIRMLFSMGISLYTSRIILGVLGVEDFGIYNVVGGVVSMFAMLNVSLASASQRFLTFELGKKDSQKLKKIFSVTLTIHNLIALIVLILAETVGLWFLNRYMNIPQERMVVANWVFQCSVFAFVVDIISVPYNASIIAHEHLKAYAYVGILEVLLKLAIVIVLPFFAFDKLKFYAVLVLLTAIIIRLIYGFYCKLHFQECKYQFYWDKSLFNEIASFAGWNFIGASSSVLMVQGVNVLLNIFYGVIVNAAQGIASQVQNAIGGFVSNFMTALNPQITKSYAANERTHMLNLVHQGSRFSFYLMLLLSLPVLIETEMVLGLWLNVVPQYAVVFVRLSLVFVITQTFSNTLVTAMLATGKIKKYQIIVGGIQLLNLPFSYVTLKIGLPPQSTLIIAILISLVSLLARLLLLRSMIDLSVLNYSKQVLWNALLVSMCSLILPMVVYYVMEDGIIRFFLVCFVSVISTSVVLSFIGLTSAELGFVKSKFNEFLSKIRK